MTPMPATAASMAASAVLTTSLDRIATAISDFPALKVYEFGDIRPAKVMQSCVPSSFGCLGPTSSMIKTAMRRVLKDGTSHVAA